MIDMLLIVGFAGLISIIVNISILLAWSNPATNAGITGLLMNLGNFGEQVMIYLSWVTENSEFIIPFGIFMIIFSRLGIGLVQNTGLLIRIVIVLAVLSLIMRFALGL